MTDSNPINTAKFGEVRWVELCDSTNTLVRAMVGELAPSDAPRAVAIADEQSAGRGRLDRRWEAQPGVALMLSVAHEAPAEPRLLGALPLAMGLAALEAIAEVTGVEPRLKWPNDVMVQAAVAPHEGAAGNEGRWLKVGGILGESLDDPRPQVTTARVAVLGIGINTGWDELRADLPDATSLNLVTGKSVDRRVLAEALLARYSAWWQRLLDGDRSGFQRAQQARSATLGQRVRVELPTSELSGTAQAITADGALMVVDDSGVSHEVTVGDVVHLRPI